MAWYSSLSPYNGHEYKRDHKHMANNSKIIVLRGKAHWAKLLGKPRPYTGNPKFDKGPYWSVDVTPLNKEEVAKLKAAGISDKLKDPRGEKETRTEPYLRLSVLELKADGEKNRPPQIVDAQGNPWTEELIGNESIVDVMIKVTDYGTTTGAYFQKLRVLRLVPYEGGGFAPLSEDDEYFATGGSVDDGAAPVGVSPKSGGGNIDAFDDDSDVPF